MTAEDVAEHRENVVHVHRRTTEAAEATHRTVEAELVVLLPLLGVMQHVVSLSSFLELLLSLFVSGIAVGMIFDGYLSICFLYLLF